MPIINYLKEKFLTKLLPISYKPFQFISIFNCHCPHCYWTSSIASKEISLAKTIFNILGLPFPIAQFFIASCRAFPTSWDNLPHSPYSSCYFFVCVFAASVLISKGNLIEQNKPFSYARIEANTSHYKGEYCHLVWFFGSPILWGIFKRAKGLPLIFSFFFCTDFLVHFTRRSKCAKSLRFWKEGGSCGDREWLPLSKDYHFLLGDIVKERRESKEWVPFWGQSSANEVCP